jgi:hypothetical protein
MLTPIVDDALERHEVEHLEGLETDALVNIYNHRSQQLYLFFRVS